MKRIAKAVFLILIFLPAIGFAELETKEVTAQGVGASEREAVEDAFRNAIEESIGVYVSSETQMQNEKLIKDNILTSSNGYIDNYRLSSVSHENGMTKVEIIALVKTQEVKSKLVSLNVSVLPADELANIHARLSTKLKRKEDAREIFSNELNEFFRPKNIADMLEVKLISYKIHENEARHNTVPYEISYELSVNLDNFNKKAKYLSNVFENLGAKLNKVYQISFDMNENGVSCAIPADREFTEYLKSLDYNCTDKKDSSSKKAYFGIVTIDNNKFKFNHYLFPYYFKDFYPWIIAGVSSEWFNAYNNKLTLRFISHENKVLFKKDISIFSEEVFKISLSPTGKFYSEWESARRPFFHYSTCCGGTNIGPFIAISHGKPAFRSVKRTYNGNINIDSLYGIEKVELELQVDDK